MYDLQSFKRFLSKKGIVEVLKYLTSPSLSPTVRENLEKLNILVGGKPNRKLIYELAVPVY